nr:hypothetical protein [Tanacetum cinerariifolium]
MTRSSTKDLFTPYKKPKQVLHSTRKLFKITSLDYSSSLEFDLFSDLKDQLSVFHISLTGAAKRLKPMELTLRSSGILLTLSLKIGNDEEVITDGKLSNPRGDDLIEENKITQIFMIDTDLLHFETPLCNAFKEFNYLLEIDVDVLTNDIHGFKTYEEYKDDWIYEWNDGLLKSLGLMMEFKKTKKRTKIGLKPDKNGKHVEAEKSLKQL